MLYTEQLSKIRLPKWPQMRVVGDCVTPDQAKEIIFRTDSFLTDVCKYSGGNNHTFNSSYRRLAGLDKLDDLKDYLAHQDIRTELGCLELSYIDNDWASSAFIYGAHGWCHPDGTIFYEDNVGKHPYCVDLVEDWLSVAKAFPFLRLNVMFMSGEGCEESTHVVFGLVVANGQVEVYTGSRSLVEQDWADALESRPHRSMANRNENGLPDAWVAEYAARVRAVIGAASSTIELVPPSEELLIAQADLKSERI